MAISGFIPTIWAAELQVSLKKAHVFAAEGVVDRRHEGVIRQAGDTVKIGSISRPTIATYTKNSTTVTPETLTDAQRSLLIDQSKYFAFEVDDIDAAQIAYDGALMTEAAVEAAYGLRDAADSYVAGLYTGVDSANAIGTVSITTSALAVTNLIQLAVRLDQANVPQDGRYVIVPPWFYGLLLGSDTFVRVDASGGDAALRAGVVGSAFGFEVRKSNNCVNVSGDDWIVQAGHPSAIAYADQIVRVEDFRPENSFSSAVKGLHVYGSKLVRPTAIATLQASIT